MVSLGSSEVQVHNQDCYYQSFSVCGQVTSFGKIEILSTLATLASSHVIEWNISANKLNICIEKSELWGWGEDAWHEAAWKKRTGVTEGHSRGALARQESLSLCVCVFMCACVLLDTTLESQSKTIGHCATESHPGTWSKRIKQSTLYILGFRICGFNLLRIQTHGYVTRGYRGLTALYLII